MNHPSYAKPQTRRPHLQLAYPGVMIVVLFVLPLLVMIALSFFRRVQGGFFEPAFVFRNYEQAFSPFFLERIWVSLAVAAVRDYRLSVYLHPDALSKGQASACHRGATVGDFAVRGDYCL